MTDDRDDRHSLRVRAVGVDTFREPVVYMRRDCHVCRSEGFEAMTRVRVARGDRSLIATLNVVTSELLAEGDVGFSDAALQKLGVAEGDHVTFSHAPPLESMGHVRAKIHGKRLDETAMGQVIRDVVAGLYSDAHVASFVTACANDHLDRDEVVALTRAMIDVGDRLSWSVPVVADKHCVGGLPGNRTTLIVVPIVAALGLVIPKTSSRAITSPSGSADAMETLAPVEVGAAGMRRVVEREGGCIVWGGGLGLSPADDILIGVERALDLDSEGQLVASVLSKKVAAGSTHVVIDLPVGPTAKVRSAAAAERLGRLIAEVGRAVGLAVRVVVSDGAQPVGRGIGPALEAKEVVAVLRREAGASLELRERSLRLAAEVVALAGGAPDPAAAAAAARAALDDGRAWRKFVAICEAQGGMREPPTAAHRRDVTAARDGVVAAIDNRRLARVAKLAGAPLDKAAGVVLHVHCGARVARGLPLFTIHAESPGELDYAFAYAGSQRDLIDLAEPA